MTNVSRVEALEAGIRFMTWIFSSGETFGEDVQTFTGRLGLEWAGVTNDRIKEGGTLLLIKRIEEASRSAVPHVFPWFEVGRNTIFLSNMAGTGAEQMLLDAAMSGYRRYLEDAQLRVEERDKLETLLRSLATGSVEKKTIALAQLRERLRDQALFQDERERQMHVKKPNNPWVSGSFYLFVVVVAGAGLMTAAQILPLVALPFVLVGAVIVLAVVGAYQLRNDEIMKDEPFLKLMALSFRYLPLFRRRDSKGG